LEFMKKSKNRGLEKEGESVSSRRTGFTIEYRARGTGAGSLGEGRGVEAGHQAGRKRDTEINLGIGNARSPLV